jgi:hypothetical protein
MSARDRLVVMVLGTVAVLGAIWILVVAPERTKADSARQALAAAQLQRSTALQQESAAQSAQAVFPANVRDVSLLSSAVPTGTAVATLLRQLESTAVADGVDFVAITAAGSGPGASAPATAPVGGITPAATGAAPAAGATPPASATPAAGTTPASGTSPAGSPAAAAAAPVAPSTASYTLSFSGKFLNLERFLDSIHHFTAVVGPSLHVHGRLLSLQSVSLTTGTTTGAGPMAASVIATVYTLPAGQAPAQLLAGVDPGLRATAGGPPAVKAQPIFSTGRIQVVP